MSSEPCDNNRFPPSAFTKREEETFEDYTAVTDWEKFTQELENLLSRWQLKADGDPTIRQSLLSTYTFTQTGYICGRLHYGDREFQLVYYNESLSESTQINPVVNDTTSSMSSSPSSKVTRRYSMMKTPCDERCCFSGNVMAPLAWFGLTHLLLLRPSEGGIKGGTRLSMLLSSVEMAVHAVKCPVPVLVEYCGPYSPYFYGLAAIPPLSVEQSTDGDRAKCDYEASVLTGALNVDFAIGLLNGSVNPSCTHLSGIQEMFLAKLGYPGNVNCPMPEVHISARFIYPLPFWPEPEELPSVDLSLFSFDMTSVSSVYPLVHLAAVWPRVPSHAVTQRASWTVLKPEGAPEWYLQLFIQTSHADRLSSRLKLFSRTCRDCDPTENSTRISSAVYTATSLISRLSWLGADLPRLRTMFRSQSGSSFAFPQSPSTSTGVTELRLTGEQVLHYLLFLFPDADSNFSCSSHLARELSCTVDSVDDITDRFRWSRKQNRASPKVIELAHKLGLPPATSLTHRLAVLMCNLYFQQPIPTTPGLLEVMFSEFILELKLRLDRLISLPDCSAYVDSEDAIYEAGRSSDYTKASTYVNAVDPADVGFEYWSESEQLNVYKVLERFNTCIQKARPLSPVKCENADFGRTVAKEVDEESATTDAEDAFFDAEEDIESPKREDNSDSETLRAFSTTQTTSGEAIEEARCILQWLQSMGRVQLMRLLMPSVCLEALITLHSITPHARLIPWYSHALEELVTQLNVILARLTDGRTSLDGYTNWEERFVHTYYEALTLVAKFSTRLNCLRELIGYFSLHVCPILSDDTLSFLCDLASGAVCGQTDWTAHSTGWVLIDRASRSFTDFQSLCGLKTPSKPSGNQSTKPVISPFRFTSSAQSWFANDPPLDLRQPTWETYVLQTTRGQPNPLTSRLGPQRLCLELNSEDARKRQYDRLLVAGAFSYDTQFF